MPPPGMMGRPGMPGPGMMPPQVQVTAQQRISMLQAEYAALKEQKSMQGKELVKIEDSVEKARRLKRDQGMERSDVEHAQAEHAEAMTKANSQMEAVRAMVQDVEMLKAEVRHLLLLRHRVA